MSRWDFSTQRSANLTVDISERSPLLLNFWMTKFVGEYWNWQSDISDETLPSISLPSASSEFNLNFSDKILATFDLPSTSSCIVRDKSDESQASLV